MITLHVVDKPQFGSSIFLLGQSQMHQAHDHIQSYYVNAAPFESSSSNRCRNRAMCALGEQILLNPNYNLKKKKCNLFKCLCIAG